MANGKISFGVGFNVDKSSLNEIRTALQEIQRLTVQDITFNNKNTSVKEAQQQLIQVKSDAEDIEAALQRAFNPKIGSLNVSKFSNELNKLDIEKIYQNFSQLGSVGTRAFQQISSSVLQTNLQLKESHKVLDEMAKTMASTVRWGISSSIFNNLTGSVQKAWNYAKDLDTSLNEIRIVTDKSASDMERFAQQANKAAQSLGASTLDYTQASTIYYQQGLNDEEVAARAETTLKAANVTGQSGEAVSEQLTAIWNGYKVTAEEAELYIDKVAKVAAVTASDLNELSTGMSKVASAAASAGVDIDQLNATLATVISVTREAPETIGTAFRSIYARLGDLALDGEDEFGVSLGTVSGQMEELGIEILDGQGQMRDMGDIIEDTAAKWQTWTQAQRQAAAVAMAGKQQYSRLIALFDNWGMYEDALSASAGAMGTLNEQNEIYLESTEAHLQQLSTAWERVFDAIINNESTNQLIDIFTMATEGVANWIEAIGGGGNALLNLGTIATRVFSKQIAQGINTTIKNFENAKFNAEQLASQVKSLEEIASKAGAQKQDDGSLAGGDRGSTARYNERNRMQGYIKTLTEEQINEGNQLIDYYANLESELQQLEQNRNQAKEIIKRSMQQETPEEKRNLSDTFAENVLTSDDKQRDIFNSSFIRFENDIKDYQNHFNNLKNAQLEFEKQTDKSSEEGQRAFKELQDAIKNVNDDLTLIANRKDISQNLVKEAKKIQKAFGEIKVSNIGTDDKNTTRKINGTLSETSKLINKTSQEIQNNGKIVAQAIDNEVNGAFDRQKEKVDSAKESVDNFHESSERVGRIESFVRLTSGISGMTAALSDLKNLGNIWNNEDLTTGEKLLQTIMSLTTGLAMLASSIQDIKNSNFNDLFKSLTEKLGNKVLQTETGQKLGQLFTKEVSNNIADGTKALTNMGKTAGTTSKAVSSVGGAATSAGAATSVAGSVGIATLGAIAAGAVVAGLAIYGIVKAYNADADAAKKAREEAEKTKEQYQQIKTQYQDLTSSISDYADSLNALKKLEEGTLEWKQAVLELNEQVLTLIDKYPELAAAIQSENGVLTITPDAINNLLEDQFDTVQNAYRSYTSNEIRALEAEQKSRRTDFRRSITYTQNYENPASTTFERTSPTYNHFGNSNNNISQIESQRFSQSLTMTEDQVDTLIDALNKDNNTMSIMGSEELLQNATGFSDDLVKALIDNRDIVEELNATEKQTNEQIKTLDLTGIQSYLTSHSDSYNNLSAGDQTRIAQAMSGLVEEERAAVDRSGDYDEGLFGWSWAGGGLSDAEIHKRYAELMGYDTENIDNKTGKAVFTDRNGESVEVDDDVQREALAQEEAMKNSVESINNYINALDNMTEAGNNAANAFGLIGTEAKNTSELLKSGFQGNFDFSTATDEQLSALQNIRNDSTQWNALKNSYKEAGYQSAQEFEKAFDEEMKQWNTPEKSAERARNLEYQTNQQFLSAIKEDAEALDISEAALQSYTEHLMDTNEALAEDKLLAEEVAVACYEFADGVEALADALDSNEQLLEDWANGLTSSTEAYEAIGALQEAIEKMFGVRVSEDYIKEHLEDLKDLANGDVSALEELQQAAAEDYVANIEINADATRAEEIKNQLDGWIAEYANKEMSVGASIDDTDFINGLNSMIENGELTASQVQDYLNSMGYEPEFEEATASTDPQTITTTSQMKFDPGGKGGLVGEIELGTLTTSTAIDGVSATMFGIKNANDTSGSKIKSIKKVSNTSNRASAIKNSGKSGQRVGSSGSSSKDKEPDRMDALEDEKDRYHDIDIILKQIQNDMDILDKQKDKLFGQDLIDNLNKQLALLDDQIDATNEKISIANGEVSELQSKLAGKGVTFNADGTIANYASAYQAQLAYVNSLIAQYNSMSAEAQEGFKDTVEKAQEDFETFVSNIERYDELITDTIPGLEADIQDAINEQIEIQIEQFNMEIEIRLNLAEAERDWNEFKKRIIDGIDDEDILGNASARLQDFYSYYKDDENGIIQANTRHVEDILQQLYQMDNTGWSDVYGDNRNQALEDLQTYYEQLMSDMNDLQDLQEEIHEAYLDMMDEAQDKFDEQIETYETISDLIEHDMNVISLVSGDESYTELAKYYEMQEDNYNKQLDFQRQQVDFWEQQMNTLEKGSDEWESAKEKWMDAVSEWNSMVEEAIENLQDKYLNAINKIFQDLNNQVTNGLGLDYVEEEWNLINENADQYLDTVNSLYEVQKLENKYLDALDETDSISARRELKEIMDEELEDLREKDKLTQYDIERANMRYEIALKQIALEEAQQNKTTMRLRRDSQGNYSYQYVADDDAVADAQDELNDLYNSLYNFDKENYQENLNQLYEVWAEFQEKMAEAAQINDPNARAERELLLQEQYGELINGLVEQNETIRSNLKDSAFEDLARLYEIDVSNFQNMSDEEQEILMSDLIPYWDSGVQHMADVFAGEGGFLGVCQEAFEQLHDATKDYEDGLTDLETTAGISFDNINDGIDDAIFKTEDLLNKNDELINAYQEEMDAIASVISQLDSLIAKYTAAKNEAIAATEAAYKYWIQEQQRAANAAAGNSSGGGAGGSGSSSGSGSGYGGSGSGSGRSGDGNLTVGDVATYSGSYYYDSYGTAPAGRRYSGVAGGIVVDKINNNPYGVHIHSSDGKFKDLGWVKKSQLTGYESGGYTGDWAGESGRLALLHQKELVLNANDTSNILNAVQILRDITDTIGSSILAKMSAITANTSIGGNLGETFEQNVHIDANFPNVTNSKEIENAIDNLMNVATQRANRR